MRTPSIAWLVIMDRIMYEKAKRRRGAEVPKKYYTTAVNAACRRRIVGRDKQSCVIFFVGYGLLSLLVGGEAGNL